MSRGGGLKDLFEGLPFADGEQSDVPGSTPSIYCRFVQQIADFAQVFRDSNHVLVRVLRYT